MIKAPIPEDEKERLEALRDLQVLDTPPEERFDRITTLAASHFGTAISVVVLIDEGREWFKSCYGLSEKEGARATSFCGHTLVESDHLVITDAAKDPRFADNPLVTKDGIRFYAGVPLFSSSGKRVGVFCIKDLRPRQFSEKELGELKAFASWAEVEINHHQLSKAITARKQVEELLSQIANNINDVFYVTSPDFQTYYYISSAFETIWGLSIADLRKDPRAWIEAVLPEDRQIVFDEIAQLQDEKKPPIAGGITFRIRRPDGSIRWIQSKTIPIRDPRGAIERMVGVSRDVTQLKLDQEELVRAAKMIQSSYNLSRSIFNSQNDAVFVISNDRMVRDMNSAAEKLFGYRLEEVKEKSTEIFHVDHEHFVSFGQAVYGEGGLLKEESFEWQLRKKDGSLFTAEFTLSPLADESGAQVGWLVVIRDVTERKNFQRRLELIYDNVSDIIFLIGVEAGENYRFVSVNKAFAVATGVPRVLVEGKLAHEVIPKASLGLVLGKYREAIQEKKSVQWEEVSEYPTGTKRGIVSITPLFDEMGQCSMIVGAVHDVTEIRNNEVRLKEVDMLKSKFIQIVSHQFRTPLNAVRWNLESLLNDEVGKLADDQRQFVRLTHDATILSIERLHDLLTALDIEEGRVRVQKEVVDIFSLTAGVVQASKRVCGVKDLQCRYDAPADETIEVQADAEKLRTALEKLTANATLYSQKGGEVGMTVKKIDGHVRIAVTDHGIGIPKAEQKKIFTRFFRASNAATMLPDASGLGLYIAKHYIEAQGGTIGFESEEGKGSTFWVELPL